MRWNIPGTVLTADTEQTRFIEEKFNAMFLGGGMVLSQVAGVTGLEPYTIQNWVKRGFLTNPVGKRYTLRQLCRIININMLKTALPMEDICGLLQYVNGSLSDESDDLIDDSVLYFLFLRLAVHCRQPGSLPEDDGYLAALLEEYPEPVPGARQRVEKVLRIMLTAWAASQLCRRAENMVSALKAEDSPH